MDIRAEKAYDGTDYGRLSQAGHAWKKATGGLAPPGAVVSWLLATAPIHSRPARRRLRRRHRAGREHGLGPTVSWMTMAPGWARPPVTLA